MILRASMTRHWLLVAMLIAPWLAGAQQVDTAFAPPFALVQVQPGEPSWMPVFRLRAAETTYRGSAWWEPYAEMRAQAEARVGNDTGATAFFDRLIPPSTQTIVFPPGVRAVPALDVLAAAADTARVIMLNEHHHVSATRLLTLQLLPILWAKGFRYLAAEALAVKDTGLGRRGYAIEGVTGYYTDDPVFGEIIRQALRLGYHVVPYDAEESQEDSTDGLNPQQRRDSIEALNLYDRIFREDPNAKVLVHAGIAHIKESVTASWSPMAAYFRKLSGIDPVTADQTVLIEHSAPAYEHPAYRAAIAAGLLRDVPVVLVDSTGAPYLPAGFGTDLEILSPRVRWDHDRPMWMALFGTRVSVDLHVAECVARRCVAEARLAAESDRAVALDRAEVSAAGAVRLFVPARQRVRVRVTESSGTVVRTLTLGSYSLTNRSTAGKNTSGRSRKE